MAKGKGKGKTQSIKVDWTKITFLVKSGLNAQEIATKLNISYSTLNNRCKDKFDLTISKYITKIKLDLSLEFESLDKHGKNKWQEVYKYVEAQCTGAEIAANYNMAPEVFLQTFKNAHGISFKEFKQRHKRKGRLLLKTKQFQNAIGGSDNMLIHLGKQYLDQRDKIDSKVDQQTILKARVLNPEEIPEAFKKLENNF